MQAIDIYAGKEAYQHIEQHGLKPEHIRMIIGASGGPKWFVLSHLDRYLVQHWLPAIPHKIDLVGSSIGAFRMACYASKNPLQAIKNLESNYVNQRYSAKPTAREVTQSVEDMLDVIVSSDDLLHHQLRKLHIIAARTKGYCSSENKLIQMMGLSAVVLGNYLSRNTLPLWFDRVIFQSPGGELPVENWDKFKTSTITLCEENYRDALFASGAIPIVIEGVKTPFGAPEGLYRDGGMVDYHFDLPFKPGNGLVLYPHFSPVLKPGWFDKSIARRKISADNYSHTVVVCPSRQFIDSLPYQKIPDRKDFDKMDTETRIRYWKTAVDKSVQIAEQFDQWASTGASITDVQPIEAIAR
jgi:hypothetical protein